VSVAVDIAGGFMAGTVVRDGISPPAAPTAGISALNWV
jgi:hypothetical protein